MLRAGYPSRQRPPRNQKPQLVDLAPEVLLHILDHLHRKKWLRSFLLVCKPLYDLALPKLYHRIEWTMPDHEKELDSYPDGDFELIRMLDKDNAGLNHIRKLVLSDEMEHTKSYRDDHQYTDAVLFAYLLPRNTLTAFHWKSKHSPPSGIYQTLISRQGSLTNIELNRNTQSIDELFGHGSFSTVKRLQNIDRLRLMPDLDEEVPAVACELLQQHREIRHLEIDLFCMLDIEDEEKAPYRSMDAMQALFTGFKLAPLSLVTLHLDRVNLKNSQQDLGPALRLEALKELRIIQCKHADMFLTVLSQTTSLQEHPTQLERLIIYHDQSGDVIRDPAMIRDPDPIITALNVFLMSNTATMHELWICLRGFQNLPNATSVAEHGSTLKWLFLDVRRTKALQQLDAAYPSVVADGDFYEHREFVEYMWETRTISRLQILGINDHPSQLGTGLQHHDANRSRLEDATYGPMMSELANNIVGAQLDSRGQMSKSLNIIAFGLTEQVERGDPRSASHSMLFAKSQVKVLDDELEAMEELRMMEVKAFSKYRAIRRVRREYDINTFAYGYLD
ncbi:hypothetical protein XANCAGTX0491_002741 [Xanthoria calcicola]